MRKLIWSGVSVLLACAAGCGKREGSGGPQAESPLPEPPLKLNIEPGKPGGRLVMAVFGEPKTFNPITANESSSTDIIAYLFAGLTRIDLISFEAEPALAESWTVADDKKTWTFKLRKGLRWGDGKPLTADDVSFTWEVIYNTNINNVVADAFRIRGKEFTVSKLDDLTIKVVTPEIYAPFLSFFGSVPIIPRHTLAGAVKQKQFESAYGINTPSSGIVGSGPYRLKEYKAGQHVLLERNPHFMAVDRNGQRLPYIQNVIWLTVPDHNAMALRMLQGESDVHQFLRPDEVDRFQEEAKKGKFQVLELGTQMEPSYLWFNQNTNLNKNSGKPIVAPTKLKWFRNQKFRQAIAHAIDRDSIIKSTYAGRARPNYGFLSPANSRWFNPNIPQYPFSQEKAKALLAEIGIQDRNGDGILEDADGNQIEFVLNTNTGNTVRQKIAVFLQEDLKKLGIQVIFQPLDFNVLVDKINTTYEYESALLAFGSDAIDPTTSMNMIKSSGFTHAWFPRQKEPSTPWEARMDQLMDLQVSTLEFGERKKYFDEVQQIFAEQLPMISIVAPQAYAVVNTRLANIRPTVAASQRVTWNVEELYFK
ncbi:MAG: ABC transporter substrate-binding protein [Verrucomicrobia subdivision 3 bacterium]|nr:ABC transporter substrate-binding protein [Limisphaerales bacterium]